MRLLVVLALLLSAAPGGALATVQPDQGSCQAAITAAEQSRHVPDAFLAAIAKVESGRRDPGTGRVVAWPWTVNALGQGSFYETKAEAIAAVQALQARGVQSIDVGCMQVNLMHHPDAFASLDQAFDPGVNAAYGASFLLTLFAQTGSWPHAAAAYHSQTPTLGSDYQKKVLAEWATPPDDVVARKKSGRRPAVRTATATQSGISAPGVSGALGGSGVPGDTAATQAGAGLRPAGSVSSGFGTLPHPVTGFSSPPPPTGRFVGNGRDLSSYRRMTVALAYRMPR